MKKIILTLIFALATLTFSYAQSIEIEKVFGGYKFTQNGSKLSMKDLVKKMESNQEAYDLIKKVQSNNTLVSVIGLASGILIGLPIGDAISGKEANWSLAGIGAGLFAIGIPISSSVNKNAKKAVELYNSSLNATSFYEFKPEFKVIAKGNGIGLAMRF